MRREGRLGLQTATLIGTKVTDVVRNSRRDARMAPGKVER